MTEGRFTYNISGRAEKVIFDNKSKADSKSQVINYLVESVPQLEKQVETLVNERDQARQKVTTLENHYTSRIEAMERELEMVRNVKAFAMEFFGIAPLLEKVNALEKRPAPVPDLTAILEKLEAMDKTLLKKPPGRIFHEKPIPTASNTRRRKALKPTP